MLYEYLCHIFKIYSCVCIIKYAHINTHTDTLQEKDYQTYTYKQTISLHSTVYNICNKADQNFGQNPHFLPAQCMCLG